MSEQASKPQDGVWTLIAPDGRLWHAPTPIQAVAKEQRERIPPEVALQNIFDALEPTEDEKRIAAIGLERDALLDVVTRLLLFGTAKDGRIINYSAVNHDARALLATHARNPI